MSTETQAQRAWQVDTLSTKDTGDVRQLFQTVFAQPMPQSLWHWKYGDDRGVASGARWSDGRLVAHFGGTRRRLCVAGEGLTVVQIGDVMVLPQVRDVWSRRAPFGSVAEHFIKSHCVPEGGVAFGFGFPNDRHMRLGRLLNLYDRLDDVTEISTSVAGSALTTPSVSGGLTTAAIDWGNASHMAELDGLWSAMLGEMDQLAVCERGASWWRHRYANHPTHQHACLFLIDRARHIAPSPQAAIVLRAHTDSGTWELLDWLGPLALAAEAWRACEQWVRERSAQRLIAWVTSPVLARLGLSSRVQAQRVCTLAITRHQGLDHPLAARLQARVWMTGGDTDFR